MSATVLAHEDDDDDDDDDVHLFDPIAPLILLVFMVIVSGFPWGANREESPLRT